MRFLVIGAFLFLTLSVEASGRLDLSPETVPNRSWDEERKLLKFEGLNQHGLWLPDLGRNTGFVDVSVGVHLWHKSLSFGDDEASNRSVLRNFQVRHLHNFGKGLRSTTVLRTSRNYQHLEPLELFVDEAFVESLGYHQQNQHQWSYSAKLGRMRYLRFPYPDLISMYDQVPDIMDLDGLRNPPKSYSGYQGLLLSSEYSNRGKGFHFSGIQWMDSNRSGSDIIEYYAFLRRHGFFDIELRWGVLANRFQDDGFFLGTGSSGYSVHMGKTIKRWHVGFLYEYLKAEGIRTGVLVEFTPNIINRKLGEWRVDYTREPQGIGLQPTLWETHYGFAKTVDSEADLKGIVLAERTTTYWQNGQGRNFYEHIIFKDGNPDSDLYDVVIVEGPTYLRVESLVSQHNSFRSKQDLIDWEASRQGPAQIAGLIEYRYYEKRSH